MCLISPFCICKIVSPSDNDRIYSGCHSSRLSGEMIAVFSSFIDEKSVPLYASAGTPDGVFVHRITRIMVSQCLIIICNRGKRIISSMLYTTILALLLLIQCTSSEISINTLKNQAWIIYNQPEGVYEYDYFNVYTFDYKWYDVYIDEKRQTLSHDIDPDTEHLIQFITTQKRKAGVFISQYSMPRLSPGEHDFRLYLSNEKKSCGHARDIKVLKAKLVCSPIQLPLFFAVTCVCKLDLSTLVFEASL